MFEINRNFRNEGISTRHNPEFTMLEFYWAYADYRDLMDLTETLLRDVAQRVCGSTTLVYQDETIDLAKPFERLTMAEAIQRHNAEYAALDLADAATLARRWRSSRRGFRQRRCRPAAACCSKRRPRTSSCSRRSSSRT